MGQVWDATDTRLGRRVAVKTPRVHSSVPYREACSRLKHEAIVTACLESEHIVRVYDFAHHGVMPFMVMERLHGATLARYLENLRRLEIETLCGLVMQVAEALNHAHKTGVVHWDVKPENIVLESVHGGLSAKLLDFGVAMGLDATPGSEDTWETPAYVSPERREHGSVRARPSDDVWALAVVAYRALVGFEAFERSSSDDIQAAVRTDVPTRPSHLRAGLNNEVDAVFERAFCQRVSCRYPTAPRLAYALRDALSRCTAGGTRWARPRRDSAA